MCCVTLHYVILCCIVIILYVVTLCCSFMSCCYATVLHYIATYVISHCYTTVCYAIIFCYVMLCCYVMLHCYVMLCRREGRQNSSQEKELANMLCYTLHKVLSHICAPGALCDIKWVCNVELAQYYFMFGQFKLKQESPDCCYCCCCTFLRSSAVYRSQSTMNLLVTPTNKKKKKKKKRYLQMKSSSILNL